MQLHAHVAIFKAEEAKSKKSCCRYSNSLQDQLSLQHSTRTLTEHTDQLYSTNFIPPSNTTTLYSDASAYDLDTKKKSRNSNKTSKLKTGVEAKY
jgi:hypothetical protein